VHPASRRPKAARPSAAAAPCPQPPGTDTCPERAASLPGSSELSGALVSPVSASPTPGSQASCPTCCPAQLYVWRWFPCRRAPSSGDALCLSAHCSTMHGPPTHIQLLCPALRPPYSAVHVA